MRGDHVVVIPCTIIVSGCCVRSRAEVTEVDCIRICTNSPAAGETSLGAGGSGVLHGILGVRGRDMSSSEPMD